MTDRDILNGLECCYGFHCEKCPLKRVPDCKQKLMDESVELINRQQEIIANISKLIIYNTYPSFDKDGNPVSIWNADGYKRIEELLKTGCNNFVCMPGDKVYQFSDGEVVLPDEK